MLKPRLPFLFIRRELTQPGIRLLSVQIKKGPPHFSWSFSTVFTPRIKREVQRQPVRLCLYCADVKRNLAFAYFFKPWKYFFSFNTGTCFVATRRATLTLVDMSMRQDYQFKTVFTVLVLAAAVAKMHGQGKKLGLARTSWGLFRVLPSVKLYKAKAELSTEQWHWVHDSQIYKCVCCGMNTLLCLQNDLAEAYSFLVKKKQYTEKRRCLAGLKVAHYTNIVSFIICTKLRFLKY